MSQILILILHISIDTMEASKIIEILSDYNFWGNFKKELRGRKAVSTLKRNLGAPLVNVVKGVRRAGKSSIVLKLIQEQGLEGNSLIINLEDPRIPFNIDSQFLMDSFEAYFSYVNPKGPSLVVIDEAQHAKGWERFARYVVETKGIKCIVTGSSSQLLSEEYATTLTGRHIDLEVYPLSFSEFLDFKGIASHKPLEIEKNRLLILNAFNEYMQYGGFPEVVLASDDVVKPSMLRNYFEDILIKDIVKRYRIKRVPQIEAIAKDCLSNISTIISMRNLANTYGVGLRTVERFLEYFSNAYLFVLVKKFSFSKREQERSLRKIYVIDAGFYSALGFKFLEQKDKLMENIVALELIRRYEKESIYYWQDYQNHEVDFIIKKGNSVVQLIQVTYASSREEVKEREIENLIKASKELKCDSLVIITWNYEAHEKYKGKDISHIPLWKWLLEL